jgi:Holliday junction resolvase-like predicted endonuclease
MAEIDDIESDPEFIKWRESRRERPVICEVCDREFSIWGNPRRKRMLCDECDAAELRERKLAINGGEHPKGLTPATLGALNELRVSIDLMARGVHIFRAQSPNCPCDLIAMVGPKLYRVEVKTVEKNLDGSLAVTPHRTPDSVDVMAYVLPGWIIYIPDFLGLQPLELENGNPISGLAFPNSV